MRNAGGVPPAGSRVGEGTVLSGPARGVTGGGGSAPATVRKIHSTLHKALSQAVSDGLIPRNAADVKAPRPTPKEMRPFSEEEVRLFLEATRGDPFGALYVLALTTGLRRGELLGLRWDDADLERGTLRVGRALVRRSFKPLLSRAGLPDIRFHDPRYTCAILLLGRSVHLKLVQDLLGHATIAMTLDTYSHYLPSMGDQVAGAMGEALG